jgi:hypothetical protein
MNLNLSFQGWILTMECVLLGNKNGTYSWTPYINRFS